MLKLLLSPALVLSFTQINFANTVDDATVKVPDAAMAQVVRRILKWHFKPRAVPTQIYLAERRIKKDWLPEIKNIEFILVPDDKLDKSRDVFFFMEFESTGGRYEIGLGHGNPDCTYLGVGLWNFRLAKQKVRLWKVKHAGFGGGCANGGGTVTSGF